MVVSACQSYPAAEAVLTPHEALFANDSGILELQGMVQDRQIPSVVATGAAACHHLIHHSIAA